MGYEGEARVYPCSEDNGEFSLSGCEKISCGSPDTRGYIVDSKIILIFQNLMLKLNVMKV